MGPGCQRLQLQLWPDSGVASSGDQHRNIRAWDLTGSICSSKLLLEVGCFNCDVADAGDYHGKVRVPVVSCHSWP